MIFKKSLSSALYTANPFSSKMFSNSFQEMSSKFSLDFLRMFTTLDPFTFAGFKSYSSAIP